MPDMSELVYAQRIEDTAVLGPGRRAALWVSGCCFDCPGCIAQNYRRNPGTRTTPGEMARWFLGLRAEGLTVSGGEPLLQAQALADMMDEIRSRADAGLIVYTGFLYEELRRKAGEDEGIRRLLAQTDLLIDGPYVQELDDGRPYRGSSNQRYLLLTDRYRESFGPYYLEEQGRKVEFLLRKDRTVLVGVPSRDQAEIWRKVRELGEKHGENH